MTLALLVSLVIQAGAPAAPPNDAAPLEPTKVVPEKEVAPAPDATTPTPAPATTPKPTQPPTPTPTPTPTQPPTPTPTPTQPPTQPPTPTPTPTPTPSPAPADVAPADVAPPAKPDTPKKPAEIAPTPNDIAPPAEAAMELLPIDPHALGPLEPPVVLPPVFVPYVAVAPAPEPAPEPSSGLWFFEPDARAPDVATTTPTPTPPVAEEERPIIVVKALVGLIALLALAYLGGHPRVRHLEQMLGISRVVAAGFPFLALGMLASSDSLGILTESVLDHLRPVLHLALGWIGLTIGIRIEFGKLGSLPRGTSTIVGIGTGLPFVMIVAGCGTILALQRGFSGDGAFDLTIVRDALIFGAAGAMAADTETLRYGARRASEDARTRLVALASLDELAGLVGLAFLNAYFRPTGSLVTWQLPNTAWLFVTFGLAFVVGFVVYAIVRLPNTTTEAVALLLGSVGFTAGMASELHLSPLVVCFVVGVLLANFPGEYQERLKDILGRLEMPIYLVFLIVAGAMWRPSALGVVMMLVLLVARFFGRWFGGRIVYQRIDVALPVDARRSLVFAPMGTLPIAIAVNAALFYPDGPVPSFLTAAIGSTIITEFFLQIFWRWQDQQNQRAA